MRIVNVLVFGLVIVLFCLWVGQRRRENKSKAVIFLDSHMYLLGVLFAANTISFLLGFGGEQGEILVEREDYQGSEKELGLTLEMGDSTEEVTLSVTQRKLTPQQQKEKMEEAFRYLEEHIKGENASLERVTKPLDFTLDYELYPFEMEVAPEDYTLLDEEGNLRNEESQLRENGYEEKDFSEGIQTGVSVTLSYGEQQQTEHFDLTIYPKEKSDVEKIFSGVLQHLVQKEKDSVYDEEFTLPVSVDGVSIRESRQSGITSGEVFVIGVILCGLLLLREKENNRQREQKRQEKLRRCYPWFVNELVLLLGAGMQVKNIIAVLLSEYEMENERKEDDREPLMEELQIARQSLQMGMPEQQVYYQLGRRLKLSCYIKLMTLLEQNVKRGTKGLTVFFEQEEAAALEERKNLAKRYGEEAGTKLLGPMMLQLLVVMLMIMVPAFMSFM
jgi:hypothetical protein